MFIFTDHCFSFESRQIIGTFMKIQNKILTQIVVFSLILISFSVAQKQLVIGAYGSSDSLNLLEAKRDWLNNMDWILYLSNAYHKKWDAFNADTNVYSFDLRHHAGKGTLLNGKYYWTNQDAPLNAAIIYGPSIWRSYPNFEERGYIQDTRYRVIANESILDTIRYRVDFYLKRLSGENEIRKNEDTLCIVKVILSYEDEGIIRDSVISKAVRSGDILNESVCYISYNLGFLENNSTSVKFVHNRGTKKRHTGTEFVVENKTTTELYAVEKVEVSDLDIWENYFSRKGDLTRLERLATYLNSSHSEPSFTISEQGSSPNFPIIPSPNSIENYDAIRIIKESITFLYKEGLVEQWTKQQKSLTTSSRRID